MADENKDIDVDALLQDVAMQENQANASTDTSSQASLSEAAHAQIPDAEPQVDAQPSAANASGDEHQAEQAQRWDLPEFDQSLESVDENQTNALNMRADWFHQDDEPSEPEEPEYVPMTIEELEALRQSAYEDGFAEGREAGIEKGQVEGHALGLEQGQQQGYEEGQTKGLEEGQAQIDKLSGQWQALINQLYTPQQALDSDLEEQVMSLVIDLAKQVIQTELQSNHQVILLTLKQALQALPIHQQQTSIHLHPDDLAVVEIAFNKESQEKQKWLLIADGSLSPGDVSVESELSSVNIDMSAIIEEAMIRFTAQNKESNEPSQSTEPV